MVGESTHDPAGARQARRIAFALAVALGLVVLLTRPDGELPEATIPIATAVGVAVYAGTDSGRCRRG